jgi:hypothetical protein
VRLFVENRPNLPDMLTPRLERFNQRRPPRRDCLQKTERHRFILSTAATL